MRTRYTVALLYAAMAAAWAQPDPAVTGLMEEPVSVWDMGLHRLQHRLDEVAHAKEWLAGGSSLHVRAHYDPAAHQIRVVARLYGFGGTADQQEAKCSQLMGALRTALGVYPPLGQPAAPTSDMVELFLRDGQAAGRGLDMNGVGRALDRMTRIHVALFRPEDLRAYTACEGPLLGTRVQYAE